MRLKGWESSIHRIEQLRIAEKTTARHTRTMRITIHSATPQQRFAVALTLTAKWLTTKTSEDVVRLFLKRYDAKHGTTSSNEDFALAVRGGDALPHTPLGAALDNQSDLELRRRAQSDGGTVRDTLLALSTQPEGDVSAAYRALARGAGAGLVKALAKIDAARLDPALRAFLAGDATRWALAREAYRAAAFARALGPRRMPAPGALPRRAEVLEPLGARIAERSAWRRRPRDDEVTDGIAALILEKAPGARRPCELSPLAFLSQNALGSSSVIWTREAVAELASYARERLELRPVETRRPALTNTPSPRHAVNTPSNAGRLPPRRRRDGRVAARALLETGGRRGLGDC